MEFTHLHLHTEYSLLDGANKIKELANRLSELGFKSCAITDHGCMFGVLDFYKTMKAKGIQPIIGMEGYLHEDEEISSTQTNHRWHICLFAKNQKGYENLMYLSSQAYINGFYRKPRINKKILKEHSEGLVCSSACLAGEINWHLNDKELRRGRCNADFGAKGYEGAKKAALWYKEVFGDDFYLEIMRMGIKAQLNIDTSILRLGRELGIKVIATNDSHYTYKDRAQAQNVFMAINTGTVIAKDMHSDLGESKGLQHSMSEIYVKSADEMTELFLDVPEVVQNTQEIVQKCNLELNLGNPTPPNFKFALEYAKNENLSLPSDEIFSFENDDILFEHLCKKGLENRLAIIDKAKHPQYYERLETEMKIIKNMHFSGYMLIVHDFIKAAKDRQIPVGPGRGSAAGSLVAYSLEITDLDPLPYNLLFERFLNPERISMPDIDVDFCQVRRGEVIDYVVEKYGRYNVAQVITFGKLLAKGVIRDVCRVCDVSIKDADTLAKLIPDELNIKLKDAYEKNPDIAVFLDHLNKKPEYQSKIVHPDDKVGNNKIGTRVWEYALALEGLNRNAGMHAAGVVISNEELWKKTPLFKQTKSDALVTQYAKDYLEDVDLIKFDFLGLKTLTVIDAAIKLIKNRHAINIDWSQIDVNDAKVYELIQTGHTLGIFQIESGGMQGLCARLKPTCFEDLIAILALYRPGPLDSGMVNDFIDIKHGKKQMEFAFPELEPILSPTYGIIVYQEQVMQIVQTIGGFSLGGADLVRRAMGKKKLEEMVKLKGQYLEGAKKGGFDEQKASDLWELILKFAEYGFNKSHSAAYALVAFQTAYLKCYYEAEFMAALLTSEEGNTTKIERYKDELDRLDIALLPPNINESLREFNVVEKDGKTCIVYGLGSIKGLGIPVANAIVEARGNSPYTDINDFICRNNALVNNKKSLEALALTGCFSVIGLNRRSVMDVMEFILLEAKNKNEYTRKVEESLFAAFSTEYRPQLKPPLIEEFSDADLASYDKEFLGIYLCSHPLDEHKTMIGKIQHANSSEFLALGDGEYEAFCLGVIEEVEFRMSKSGKNYASIKALDYYSNFSALSFSEPIIDELEKEYKTINQTEGKKERKLYGFCLSFKVDNEQVTYFLSKLIKIDENTELKEPSDEFNELGIRILRKKVGGFDFAKFSQLTNKIQHFKMNEAENLSVGEWDAFSIFCIKNVDYRISKKGKEFAQITATSDKDYRFFCFDEVTCAWLKQNYSQEKLFGMELNIRITYEDEQKNISQFIESICIIDENTPLKEPVGEENELGFVVLKQRVAKKNRFAKKNLVSNETNLLNSSINYKKPKDYVKGDYTEHPKAFEGEIISIDVLNLKAEIFEQIVHLLREDISGEELKEKIAFEFMRDSCVLKYSKPRNFAKAQIERIKELLAVGY